MKRYVVRPFGCPLSHPLSAAFWTRKGALRYARELAELGVRASIGRVAR